ncbi:hypothetical protein [Bradyrhizobium sp. 170]|uniref:hypothetical protein n=1 Tax=Bradyrhizobium sp. 170 TaxID=2782641 RepID=UPI00200025D3|nr:hypothetical protein [Bradyrhizobium sp. 170]UPK01562.1 hypothetical protein IVB05_28360 [Bradyrhizobium sp. 170]
MHGRPRFLWRWFLGWTLVSSVLIFTALKILTGMSPPEPFLLQPFIDVNMGRLVLVVLIAVTVVFSVYFLAVATLPGIGPHTSPAGRWLVVTLVLVICMTALLVAGAISYQSADPSAFTWDRFLAFVSDPKIRNPSHETLAIVLLLTLTLALSTAAVVSNLATSLRDCTDEQNETIRWFLLWMHAGLTLIMLAYSALLFKTTIRLPQFADGLFILYFGLFYLMISVLIFLIPAVQYKLLTTKTVLVAFAGINLPPWISSFLSTAKLEKFSMFMKFWERV